MDLRDALIEQYRGGLVMLRQCVERCSEDLWNSGTPPRTYWRIAYHTVFYAHLYLGQSEATFQPWPERKAGVHMSLDEEWEGEETYSRDEILAYLDYLQDLIEPTIRHLDLDSPETGFDWYPNMTKLSHQLLNLRHIQGHVGQLSELLMARGIDIDWVAKG